MFYSETIKYVIFVQNCSLKYHITPNPDTSMENASFGIVVKMSILLEYHTSALKNKIELLKEQL